MIETSVVVTSTNAKILAWETALANYAHTTSGTLTLKDDTAYAYFGRAEMNFIPKSEFNKSTSLGAVNTALTGATNLLGMGFATAAALYTAMVL